jgi:pyridoxine/pyridoxamine 5'-phosphate oxidase
MTTKILKEVKAELHKGVTEKGHPFRYCILATVGLENIPRQRTVVLRELGDDLHLNFYTDLRSKKIIHIHENKKVSLMFLHPEKLLQIRVEGLAKIHRDHATLDKHRKNLLAINKKNFSTAAAPGTTIANPNAVDYLKDADYFCVVEVNPFKIEYLKLEHPNHIRVRFAREGADWDGEYLVP